ncbi:glycerol kinase GlpK [Facklamia miroungae]|uniref:Glycerol kinase n=1 Tax=Facklamia miroungae TaxID=120956 RepID=A0A1G7TT11_9LACT|nr:glycerol kinase GlpK [Facklamia miroungae]NKZ29939.1 glycerol kinase GlpK [Facklamia miroungae]SDG37809.1 glycerol kinase [Facklamia miroungae]
MLDEQYVMSIDQGTTSTRAVIVNRQGEFVSSAQKEFQQFFPQSGWVEQDANEIWQSVQSVISEALINGNIQPQQIKAIGVTNQRETTVVWDRKSGEPIYRAIVWQSRQSSDICERVKKKGLENFIKKKTGLPIDPYFSASKIRWILDFVPGAHSQAQAGELAFGTIDSWLMWKISGGRHHITDYSNASRTLLFNIETLEWDQELLAIFDIPLKMLPKVVSNSEIYGKTATYHFYGYEIPLAGMAGDQQAALIGQLAFKKGQVKSTYGTGAFILMNIGHQVKHSQHALATSIAYKFPDQPPVYCIEGSIFVAGSAVQWLRDGLEMIKESADSEKLAEKSENEDEVFVVPAFTGLGAPYWDPQARGAVFGLTRGTNKADFVKATLQSLAYQVRDIIDVMKLETGVAIPELKVDGGAAKNNYLMQFQADILNTPVTRLSNLETTALGAAFLAGLAVGYWDSIEEIQMLVKPAKIFKPQMSASKREHLYKGWERAVQSVQFFGDQSK